MSDPALLHPSADQLTALRLGQLSPADAHAVTDHLHACPACRALVETLPPEARTSLARTRTAVKPATFPAGPPPGAPAARASAAKAAGQDPAALPEQFAHYRVVRLLGRGGMGSVYLAQDQKLDRLVALKVPHFTPEDGPQFLERFYREARAAATIEHPNICPVYEVGDCQGVHYLAMRYLEGQPLSEFVRGGKPLPQRQAAALVGKLALAVQAAHAKGVIHRDLKPANVMLVKGREPVILDFGLARRSNAGDPRVTGSGVVLGTPAYMAPEQAAGNVDALGPASDIYSLGVVLYELLTGQLPFTGPVAIVWAQVLSAEPPPVSELRPDVAPALAAVCHKAMAKKAADRFGSMAEFAAALSGWIRATAGGPAPAAPPSAAPPSGPARPPSAATDSRVLADAYKLLPEPQPPGPPEAAPAAPTEPARDSGVRRPKRKREQRRVRASAVRRGVAVGAGVLVIVAGAAAAVYWLGRGKPETQTAQPVAVKADLAAPPARSAAPATRPETATPAGPQEVPPSPPPQPTTPSDKPGDPGLNPTTPPAVAPAKEPPLTPEEQRWRTAIRARLAAYGPARFSSAELGPPLSGVVVELDVLGPNRVKFEADNVRALRADGSTVRAGVLFLPSGRQGLESGKSFKGTTSTTGDIRVGRNTYSFQQLVGVPVEQNLLLLPILLHKGAGVEYDFRPGATLRLGFLFAAGVDQLASVRVLGHQLTLDPSFRSELTDAPGVAAAPAMPGGPAAPEVAPAERTRDKPAVEVYRFHPNVDVGSARSKNIQIVEGPNGSRTVTGLGNNSQVAMTKNGNVGVPDALGSTGLRVVVRSKPGYTTVAGLRFQQNCTVNTWEDGVVEVSQAGVRATDEFGERYVSRRVPVNGRTAIVMVKAVPLQEAAPQSPADPKEKEEQAAASRLSLAKTLLAEGKAARGLEYLEEIIAKHPDTKAAGEAKQLLEKYRKN
jgi:serine/threonine protein kinase